MICFTIIEYPWLKSPPQLESSDFKSIKLKIDLNSENIQGSSNVKSEYYQILFKVKKKQVNNIHKY